MDAFFVNLRYALVKIMEKNPAISAVCFYVEVVRHLGWKRETVIPVKLMKQTPSLFISPSILHNFSHSLSYFRRPNLSIFSPFLQSHHQNLSCDLTRTRCVTDKFGYQTIINNSAVSEMNVEITAKLFSFFRKLTLRDFTNSFAIR